MLAVLETGGKQYKVAVGDIIKVDRLAGNPGDKIDFDKVLLIADDKKVMVGKPYVEKAIIVGEFLKEVKADKLVAYKYKRRKDSSRKIGHRQKLSQIKISKIIQKSTKSKEE